MRSIISSLALGAGLANALPQQHASEGFMDSYDALSTNSSIGLLHNIQYHGANVRVARLANGTRPIVPYSSPKSAQGDKPLAYIQSDGVSFDSYIHIDAGTSLNGFDVYNFYYACVTITETGYGSAQSCEVAVKGSASYDQTETFQYDPATSNEAPFAKAQISYPNLRRIYSLDIGIVRGSTPAGKVALAIDSLYHLNYNAG